MEPLITVAMVLAIATIVTGLLLPLTTRRKDGQVLPEDLEARYSMETTAWQ